MFNNQFSGSYVIVCIGTHNKRWHLHAEGVNFLFGAYRLVIDYTETIFSSSLTLVLWNQLHVICPFTCLHPIRTIQHKKNYKFINDCLTSAHIY